MADEEYITKMTVWKNELGLTHIHFLTSESRSFGKGNSVAGLPSDQSKTFVFDARHRLVGFKGLVSDAAIYSIGTILLDSACNISDTVDPAAKSVERQIVEVE